MHFTPGLLLLLLRAEGEFWKHVFIKQIDDPALYWLVVTARSALTSYYEIAYRD
jgi:hypothetical protein